MESAGAASRVLCSLLMRYSWSAAEPTYSDTRLTNIHAAQRFYWALNDHRLCCDALLDWSYKSVISCCTHFVRFIAGSMQR
ncbi:unnamed protein product [Gongylonema pulchrum]|uniref:Secreted protein n=1 Tax=Gongylonema pulchrum TaxID=637853 RepID=A0A183DZB4_9BILA|nr:unnamed protein product [Gongylonema pulchrum]